MMRLLRDRAGAAAVEFAVTAPIVLLTITAAVEAFHLHAAAIALETGAAAAVRFGSLGATAAGEDRQDALRRILTEHVCPTEGTVCYWAEGDPLPAGDDGVISPLQMRFRAYVSPLNIGLPEPFADIAPPNGSHDAAEPYTDLNGNGRWDPDMGRSDLGGAGDFVAFDVAMNQTVRHPMLRAAFGATLVHGLSFTVRNEPF